MRRPGCFPLHALLAGCLWTVSAGAQEWSGTLADQQISFDDNEYARAVQMLVDPLPGGTAHIFFTEDSPSVRELHYGRSTDLGESWTSEAADRIISFPDGNSALEECDVAQSFGDPHGTIVVAWSEPEGQTREAHYGVSLDDGITWSSEYADRILSDPASAVDTGTPSLACDGAGVFHVVWGQVSAGVGEIFYSRSTDDGSSWSGSAADRRISFPDGNGAVSPQIVVGEDDRLLVAWRESGDGGLPSIHLGISTDGGETWSSETQDREISLPARLITDLAAASRPFPYQSGEIHVVYRASFDPSSPYYYEIYATSSFDNGASWTGETETTPVSHDEGAGRSASNPDLFLGVEQGAIAVWDEELDGTEQNEQHISRGGPPWSGALADRIISFPDGEDGYRPSISGYQFYTAEIPGTRLDRGQADTFVAWTEFAGGASDNYEVHLSRATLVVNSVPQAPALDADRLHVYPNPARAEIGFACDAAVTGDSESWMAILDPSGRIVARLASPGSHAPLRWNRRDLHGRTVPAGVYTVRLRTPGGMRRALFVLL